jgi:hypothetical protein
MSINRIVFEKQGLGNSQNLEDVRDLAQKVFDTLNSEKSQKAILEAHVFNASSHSIQAVILEEMNLLGFSSEKKGLFSEYSVSGIRPDYFKQLEGGGILFEVERGKTLANNMDLLDVWKTHICKEAQHLFLLVPNIRVQASGNKQNIFNTVSNRLGAFFEQNSSPIDVSSVTLFGY